MSKAEKAFDVMLKRVGFDYYDFQELIAIINYYFMEEAQRGMAASFDTADTAPQPKLPNRKKEV